MSVSIGATLMGRRQAESQMESTCIITRKTGTTVDASGANVDVFTVIYDSGKGDGLGGKCKLRFPFVRPQEVVAAGQTIAKDRGILSLPIVGSNAVLTDDVATITISPVLDPGTVVTARIEAPIAHTHATARRFPVSIIG
jgi:serine acetyltransferase